jgi:hypothetical protein
MQKLKPSQVTDSGAAGNRISRRAARIPPERQRAWVLSVPAREANLTAQL